MEWLLRMKVFRIFFLCLLIIFLNIGVTFAEMLLPVEWEDTHNPIGEKIYLDYNNIYSIGWKENITEVFYNIKVFVPDINESMVYTIHAKKDMTYGIS